MLGIARMNIDTAGGLLIEGSTNVFVNNMPAVRVGDRVQSHPGHSNVFMSTGSSTVFVNSKPVCRQNDVATCLHVATGSANVFSG